MQATGSQCIVPLTDVGGKQVQAQAQAPFNKFAAPLHNAAMNQILYMDESGCLK